MPGGRARHRPFGEHRVEPEAGLSGRGLTGHRELGGTGLVNMRARLYSAELGRFVSPDILIPDPADPQSYNRYSYVLNSPLRFTDPTGRCPIGDSDCWALADDLYTQYGWYTVGLASHGVWTLGELQILWDAAMAIEGWLAEHGGGDARGRMRAALGGTQFAKASIIGNLVLRGNHHVRGSKVHLLPGFSTDTVVHEIAHVIDNRAAGYSLGALLGGGIADEMARELGGYPEVCGNRSRCPGFDAGYSEQPWDDDAYARHGPSEDFAEIFRLSVRHPGQLSPTRATFMVEMGRSLTTDLGEFEGSPYSAMERYGQGYIRPHGFGAGSYPVNSLQLFQ